MLIDNGADFDRARKSDGSRLLDRLISEHSSVFAGSDKLKFIDCLLQSGAKLGSSTWLAANGKRDVQLRLLKKLCQDGYFLYKVSTTNKFIRSSPTLSARAQLIDFSTDRPTDRVTD